jgi:hypothetical protein
MNFRQYFDLIGKGEKFLSNLLHTIKYRNKELSVLLAVLQIQDVLSRIREFFHPGSYVLCKKGVEKEKAP